MKALAIVAALLLAVAANACDAAPIPLGPNPRIGGIAVSCGGVPTWLDDQLQDIAIAVPGAIVLHPMLGNWPAVVQVFVYAHECAHQLPGICSNENAADCWAVKLGRDQGWIDLQGLRSIGAFFAGNPGNWSHLPGPLRVQQLQACFAVP